jgi:peptidoglycan/LPS O-acetylase OafA/YrhL
MVSMAAASTSETKDSVPAVLSRNRIPTLDGWRGVAILLVLVDHAIWGGQGTHPFGLIGQHGVAIFFVLSGYLITSNLQKEFVATGRLNLVNFYLRRFFRLMPAAWLYLAFIALLACFLRLPVRAREFLGCLFFFRNYVADGTNFTGHFWSLSLEEQFYLAWPPLIVMIGFRRSRFVACLLAAAIAIYRFHHRGMLLSLPFWSTFQTQFRADSLLAGCAAALILPQTSKYLRAWMIYPLLACMAVCFWRYGQMIPLIESVLIAILLHTSAIHPTSIVGRILDWRGLVYIGTISYSLYIWQQAFLFSHSQYIIGVMHILFNLVTTFGIAMISYHWLEAPLVKFGHTLTGAQRSRVPEATNATPDCV